MNCSVTCVHVGWPYKRTEPKPQPDAEASSTDLGPGSGSACSSYDDAGVDDHERVYPWVANRDDRFTLALVLDVGEVLSRHGYPAPTGATLVDLTAGLYRALHPYPAPTWPPQE